MLLLLVFLGFFDLNFSVCPSLTAQQMNVASDLSTDVSTSSFTGPVTLDSTIGYKIYHKVVNDVLHLILESQDATDRWLGFGFAEQSSGHMKGSDLVTIKYSTTGSGFTVEDRYAEFKAARYDESNGDITYPDSLAAPEDTYNDWIIEDTYRVVSSSTGIITTKVHISRPIDTGDNQDREIGLGPRNVVWAYGSSTSVVYHGTKRGVTKITFRDIPSGGTSPDSADMSIDSTPGSQYDGKFVLQMSYSLTTHKTAYICQSFNMKNDSRRSIVGIKAIPNPNTAVAHHALIHICQNNAYWNAHVTAQGCTTGNPDSQSSPLGEQSSGCGGMVYSWAVGMNDFIFPDDVGIPIGTGVGDVDFVIVEMHYDNPSQDNTIVDDFQFEIYYKDTQTTHAAATMIIGDATTTLSETPGNAPFAVGPLNNGDAEVHRQATCPSTCSNEFQDTSVTVLTSFLHMHYMGQKIVLEQYDSSKNLIAERARIDFWDNGFQHMLLGSDHQFTWSRGDALQIHCYYNTAQSNLAAGRVDFGGQTSNEMCMVSLIRKKIIDVLLIYSFFV